MVLSRMSVLVSGKSEGHATAAVKVRLLQGIVLDETGIPTKSGVNVVRFLAPKSGDVPRP